MTPRPKIKTMAKTESMSTVIRISLLGTSCNFAVQQPTDAQSYNVVSSLLHTRFTDAGRGGIDDADDDDDRDGDDDDD